MFAEGIVKTIKSFYPALDSSYILSEFPSTKNNHSFILPS